MGIEQHGLDLKEKAKRENPSEPQGPDLQSVLADSDQSKLFGAHLKEKGEEELFTRFHEGTSDAADLKKLNTKLREFNNISRSAEELSKTVELKDLEEIIESSSSLKQLAELVKAEGIREVFQGHLQELAVKYPRDFKKIKDALEVRVDTRKRITVDEKKIEEFCKPLKITVDQYLEIIRSGDQEKLDKLAWGQLSNWRKARAGSQKTRDALDQLLAKAPDLKTIDAYLAQLEQDRKLIGDTFALTLNKNDMMRKALIANIKGMENESTLEADFSFEEFGRAMKPNKEEVKKKFEEFKKKNKQKYQPQVNAPFDERRAREDFAQEYGPSIVGKRGGFFATIFNRLFSVNIIEDLLKP